MALKFKFVYNLQLLKSKRIWNLTPPKKKIKFPLFNTHTMLSDQHKPNHVNLKIKKNQEFLSMN